MRHRVYGKHLGRTRNERMALFKNLVQALILSEKIETTEAKAKAVKGLIDKLVTAAKSPNTQKIVRQFFAKKDIEQKFLTEITPRLAGRNSGYTSVTRLGPRAGDNTMMVRMSLLLEEGKKSGQKSGKSENVKPEQALRSKNQELRRKTVKSKKS